MFSITRESRDCPQLGELVRLLDAYLDEVYGVVQAEYRPFNSLASIDGAVIAFKDTLPVACGCYKRFDDRTAEIKRMFVHPSTAEAAPPRAARRSGEVGGRSGLRAGGAGNRHQATGRNSLLREVGLRTDRELRPIYWHGA